MKNWIKLNWKLLSIVAALAIGFIPVKGHTFWGDSTSTLGTIFWVNNGSSAFVQGTNQTNTLTWRQSVAPASETDMYVFTGSSGTWKIETSGHVLAGQPVAPTASANCAITTGSTDAFGSLVISGGATSACTITFNTAYASVPFCVAVDSTTTNAVQTSPGLSSLVLTMSAARNDTLAWNCVSH